ncbi:unnamed protein product [Mytilus edulis]|uniref:Uncharacterized protein n=1 Tax=Mytilus edulis TaxID=6550 RepID=A0A8S3RS90_MYTED|nr:unnamed protein product [Mytilus edulis]
MFEINRTCSSVISLHDIYCSRDDPSCGVRVALPTVVAATVAIMSRNLEITNKSLIAVTSNVNWTVSGSVKSSTWTELEAAPTTYVRSQYRPPDADYAENLVPLHSSLSRIPVGAHLWLEVVLVPTRITETCENIRCCSHQKHLVSEVHVMPLISDHKNFCLDKHMYTHEKDFDVIQNALKNIQKKFIELEENNPPEEIIWKTNQNKSNKIKRKASTKTTTRGNKTRKQWIGRISHKGCQDCSSKKSDLGAFGHYKVNNDFLSLFID